MTIKKLIGAAEAARKLGLSRSGFNRRIHVGAVVPIGKIGPRGINIFDAEYIEKLAEIEKAKYE